jgi:hypothetical protein
MLLTGGGFLTLNYPHAPPRPGLVLQNGFLQQLGAWTENELVDVIQTIKQSCGNRDFVIGVDVLVNEQGSGQFALRIGRDGHTLVAKRYPVSKEDRYLAGFEATSPVYAQRVVQTTLGLALLLVCHDAQAFNHRNQESVANATRITPRARAIQELHTLRITPGLTWALNLVHWVGAEGNTRTFIRSYDQMRTDFSRVPLNVVGSFGYVPGLEVMVVSELLRRMTSPAMNLPKVIIQSVASEAQ